MEVDFAHKIGCYGNVPQEIEKNNFMMFICSQSSTNRVNFVNVRSEDVGITGLTEITWARVCLSVCHKPVFYRNG